MNQYPPALEWAAYQAGMLKLPSSIKPKVGLFFDYGDDLSIATGTSGVLNIGTEPASDFMIESIEIISSLQTSSDDLFTVQISDTTYGNPWSNVSVPGRDIAGIGYAPKILTYPQFIQPAATINVNITNNSGSTAQFYVSMKGHRIVNLTDAERNLLKKRQWYQYVMSVPTIAGSTGPVLQQMQIYSESDFLIKSLLSWELTKATLTATQGGVSGEMMTLIRDLSSGYQLQNKPHAARLMFGASRLIWQNAATAYVGGSPYNLTKPYLAKRNTTLEAQFTNLATSASGAFHLVFEGARLY